MKLRNKSKHNQNKVLERSKLKLAKMQQQQQLYSKRLIIAIELNAIVFAEEAKKKKSEGNNSSSEMKIMEKSLYMLLQNIHEHTKAIS